MNDHTNGGPSRPDHPMSSQKRVDYPRRDHNRNEEYSTEIVPVHTRVEVPSPKRAEYPRKDHKEEYSSEVAPMHTRAGTSSQKREDYPRNDHREEYSAEVAPVHSRVETPKESSQVDRPNRMEHSSQVDRSDDDNVMANLGNTIGYVGLGLGIASLFMWSIILGPLAAVTGFYAYSQGNKTTGAWAIGLGIVSTLSYFVLIPFTR